jgi:hypothetical protein
MDWMRSMTPILLDEWSGAAIESKHSSSAVFTSGLSQTTLATFPRPLLDLFKITRVICQGLQVDANPGRTLPW